MKKLKVYIENSVIGGYFDKEFEKASKILFEYFRTGIYKPVISSHVMFELNNGAPQYVLDNLDAINYEYIDLNGEMEDLADLYLKNNIVSRKYYGDALHIAIATVSEVDVLVSWNFRHIVNLDKIKKFNSVNLSQGCSILEIRTPMEMINNE